MTLFAALLTVLATGCCALVLSLLFTRLALFALPRLGFLDKPDFQRHIHTVTVPRGGGIGFLLAFLLTVTGAFFLLHLLEREGATATFLAHVAPLAILIPLGLLDDRFTLKARTKFLFQILAAILAWCLGIRLESLFQWNLPPWIGAPLTVLWIVGLINAFNMIDGIDGLAAGVGIISATCLALVAFCRQDLELALFLMALVGSLLGFLRYNWHPAKIFMGDTGSMVIGYLLAAAGLSITERILSIASIGIPLLACGIPILDICLAVWRRLFFNPRPTPERPLASSDTSATIDLEDSFHGLPLPDNEWLPPNSPTHTTFLQRAASILQRLGTADQRHLHHRLLRHFHNNWKKTIGQIYLLAACMGLAAVACSILPGQNLLLALICILGTFSFILNRLAMSMLWSSPESLNLDFHTARTGLILAYFINPIVDLVGLILAYYLASDKGVLAPQDLLRFLFIIEGTLLLSRNYRTFWNFAVLDDFSRLVITLILGFTLARLSEYVFPIRHHIPKLHTCAGGIALSFILAERLFLHYYKNRKTTPTKASPRKPLLRTLLFGITPHLRLYRETIQTQNSRSHREILLGLLAKDPKFIHGYCFGLKVLGTLHNLEKVYQDTPFDKLVLIKPLHPQDRELVQAFAAAHPSVTITTFQTQETPLPLEKKKEAG